MNPELVLSILLNYGDDLTGCLSNCSNKGTCELSLEYKLVCNCQENFIGDHCETDSRPCSSSPCQNNGTCSDMANNKTSARAFGCICQPKYYGEFCQFKENVCAGKTCSWAGRCFDNSSVPACKCFKFYSGGDCQVKSEELKAIKRASSNLAAVAITTICLFYVFVVSLDALRLWSL